MHNFFNWTIPGLFSLYLHVKYIQLMVNKICQRLDSNHWSLASEATSLPTEPQPQSKKSHLSLWSYIRIEFVLVCFLKNNKWQYFWNGGWNLVLKNFCLVLIGQCHEKCFPFYHIRCCFRPKQWTNETMVLKICDFSIKEDVFIKIASSLYKTCLLIGRNLFRNADNFGMRHWQSA